MPLAVKVVILAAEPSLEIEGPGGVASVVSGFSTQKGKDAELPVSLVAMNKETKDDLGSARCFLHLLLQSKRRLWHIQVKGPEKTGAVACLGVAFTGFLEIRTNQNQGQAFYTWKLYSMIRIKTSIG